MLDGRKTFPIVLAKGPPADGLEEVASAGVNFIKVGPVKGWTDADIAETIGWNRAAAAAGIQTWINLSSLSRARPGGWQEELLRHVVGSLEADPSAARDRDVEGRRRALALPGAPVIAPVHLLPRDGAREAQLVCREAADRS